MTENERGKRANVPVCVCVAVSLCSSFWRSQLGVMLKSPESPELRVSRLANIKLRIFRRINLCDMVP